MISAVTDTPSLCALLLAELDPELRKTRRVLEHVPESRAAFQYHERSRSLAALAGHTADLVSFLEAVLIEDAFDFGSEHRTPLVMESSEQLLAVFDASAARTIEALRASADTRFQEQFRFLFNGRVVFSGSRYMAYRVNTLDHLIHHRAQMGVYLRLVDARVPALYGPSADEFPRY